MKKLREKLESEFSLLNHKANKNSTRKTICCFAETIGCLYQFSNIKTEFKEIKDRENAHRGLYWFTLNPMLHPVFPETTGESTKQSPQNHLQHNQRSDLDPLKTHTSFGFSTTTLRMLVLIPSRTHNTSQLYTQSSFQKYKGLHLLQNKSEINTRWKSYLTLFDQCNL